MANSAFFQMFLYFRTTLYSSWPPPITVYTQPPVFKEKSVLADATLTSIFPLLPPHILSPLFIISQTVSTSTDLILSQSFFFSFVEGINQ